MSAQGIRAGRAFVEIGANSAPLKASLARVRAQLTSFGASLTRVGGTLAGLGAGALGALSWPLKLAANLEAAEARFKTLLGSAEAAKGMMEQLEDFSTSTPFQFPQIADAAASLLAAQVNASELVPTLSMLGDVAAASGKDLGELTNAFAKAKTSGQITMEILNMFLERGINVAGQMAQQMGVTDMEFRKLVSSGKVQFQDFQAAIQRMTAEGGAFHNGMLEQAQTLLGKLSTLYDKIAAALRPLGQALMPIVKSVVDGLTTAAEVIGGFISKNKQLAVVVAGVATAFVVVGGALAAAGVSFALIGSAIGGIATVWTAVTGAVAAAIPVLTSIGVPLLAAGAAAAAVGLTLAGLVGTFIWFLAESGLLQKGLQYLADAFGKLMQTVRDTMGGIGDALQAGELLLALRILWQGMKVAVLQGGRELVRAVGYVWENAWDITASFFEFLLEKTVAVFTQLPKLIRAAIQNGNIGELLAEVISGDFDLGSVLDDSIADAQKKLDELRKEAAAAREKLEENDKAVGNDGPLKALQESLNTLTSLRDLDDTRDSLKLISEEERKRRAAYEEAMREPRFSQQSAGTFNTATLAQQFAALNENDLELRYAKRTAEATETIAENTEEGAVFN